VEERRACVALTYGLLFKFFSALERGGVTTPDKYWWLVSLLKLCVDRWKIE